MVGPRSMAFVAAACVAWASGATAAFAQAPTTGAPAAPATPVATTAAAAPAAPTEPAIGSASEQAIARLIQAVSPNGGGKISLDDARKFVRSRFDALDPGHNTTLTSRAMRGPVRVRLKNAHGRQRRTLVRALKTLATEFKVMDRDRDGTVDKNEYVALVEARFAAANTDGDTTLEANELAAPAGERIRVLLAVLAAR